MLTHFLAPETMGEVSVASVLFATAQVAMGCGVGTFVVTRSRGRPEIGWHATVIEVTGGVLAIGAILALEGPLLRLVGVPGAAVFLPGLAAASLIERMGQNPERILERELLFSKVARGRTAGEVGYVVLSIGFAALGLGGHAIVIASIGRAVLRTGVAASLAPPQAWIVPRRLSWQTMREIAAFTIPLTVANFAGFASRKWDNLIMSRFHGATVLGEYNLAYNLADIPGAQVGDPICDVLMSSLPQLARERHEAALVRAISLSSLLVFPLAVGLSAVATTTVTALLPARWAPVGPMLLLLASLSLMRPISSIACSYLIVRGRTRVLMWLTMGHLLFVGAALFAFGRASALGACGAVGAAFGVTLSAELLAVQATEKIPARTLLLPVVRPLLACGPLVIAVVLARAGLRSFAGDAPRLGLVAEILAGAMAYIVSAWLIAPAASRDLIRLLRRAAGREA